jgi:hypothetical protein
MKKCKIQNVKFDQFLQVNFILILVPGKDWEFLK